MSPQPLGPEALELESLPMLRYVFGRAAHDLNNSLSGPLGYFSLIRKHLGDHPDCGRFFELMERSGNDMAAVLKALADFGKPAGADPAPVDVNMMVRAAVSQVVESTGGGLEAALELDETVPRVSAAAGSLREAVERLLMNALEASDARPAPVTVRTGVASLPSDLLVPPGREADGWVCVEVADTGAGMDPEEVGRCIVPFHTTKRATGQHGLGLALVRSYVCAWGGGLDVRSAPGAGTTVGLYLQAARP